VYDVARVIDDLGDEAPGDRTAALRKFRSELEGIWHGVTPQPPVLRRLAVSVAACELTPRPFLDLVEANLVDQRTTTYATFQDLLGYCALSANPVGRIVLEVFMASTPERVAWSDRVCTGLQIIEHCQDVGEDYRAGRIYMPLEDLERFGVRRDDLGARSTTPAVRDLIRFEAERASRLLDSGVPLVRDLRGWARLAVAGYVAGGRAAVAALGRGGWSVLPSHPPVRKRDVLLALIAVWRGRS
jgi:squalene synthase HpnC